MASISPLSVVRQSSLPDDDAAVSDANMTDIGQGHGGEGEGKDKRHYSTIEFPYANLEDAIAVAQAIFDNSGDRAELSSLYAWLGHQSVMSGAFRQRVSAARMFGLATVDSQSVVLTPLAIKMLDPSTNRQARVEAFLSVPLYRKIYDRFKGRILPKDAGLESEMVSIGVTPKQRERARQVFQRSASQAGFFGYGQDRLVVPNNTSLAEAAEPVVEPKAAESLDEMMASGNGTPTAAQSGSGAAAPNSTRTPRYFGSGGGMIVDVHPLIVEMVRTLPEPTNSPPFQEAELKQWVGAFEQVLRIVYKVPLPRSASGQGE